MKHNPTPPPHEGANGEPVSSYNQSRLSGGGTSKRGSTQVEAELDQVQV